MPVFALVDCNNFYASCEKLFDPKLAGKPVVVLSNNDGCVVARSAESKALGVPMGAPWFQLKDMARQYGIVAFSSNYALYADMSNRVVEILGQFTPNLEVYSIDESFLDLSGFWQLNLAAYSQEMRERILQWVGLPVCVGIAPTKTLAKLANHCAKKSLAGADGVCDFTTLAPAKLDQMLSEVTVGEVWGVGRRLTQQLESMGIHTAQDLRRADAETIRRRFSVVLERTVRELRGVSCLELEEIAPPKQQIMCSRSFGQTVQTREELAEAVASYVGRAAEKLRIQHSLAGALMVFVQTNPFKPREPQYQKTMTMPLPEPTADTRMLTQWALRVLKRIYQPGFDYQKAGIMLSELVPVTRRQASLFDNAESNEKSRRLMQAMDAINSKWGRGTTRLLAEGIERSWKMRRGHLSPGYTTDWKGLPAVKA